ncbi:hypothetical protein ACFL96_12825 [Thermoproteota archaeon]
MEPDYIATVKRTLNDAMDNIDGIMKQPIGTFITFSYDALENIASIAKDDRLSILYIGERAINHAMERGIEFPYKITGDEISDLAITEAEIDAHKISLSRVLQE